MIEKQYLLDDAQVMKFVVNGFHLVEPDLPAGLNEAICDELARLEGNPGNGILERVPLLNQVYDHPTVHGALVSLLGHDMQMNAHRHWHVVSPGDHSQGWHQDGTNVRHHQVQTVLAMYYPHDVPPEMGPTVVLPGSHFRNAPTDRMASYANIRGQKFLTVTAGTVAITHYDLWHAGTTNRTDKKRSMLKFLFDRKSEPTTPSWNHDPQAAPRIAHQNYGAMVGPDLYYNSDYYKEWELRREMWEWLNGLRQPVPPGAFKDMLVAF